MFASLLGSGHFPSLAMEEDKDGIGWMISVPIAACLLTQREVYVDSRLVPADYAGQSCWEFSFEIAVVSLDESYESFTTQDHSIAKNYIPDEVRPMVMVIVNRACSLLLNEQAPERVYFVTKGRNVPEKGLQKYWILMSTLEACGYEEIEHGTDPAGRTFWVMDRMGS
ncbi:hypothetical protein [Azospirillum sp. SYSU D00513]|uniref:hypothetical protein n=1 Tax=Azospirillum sp. SYSU D00513 TaxID=2812561 RepID=UPI001A9644CA|nr:hypothetical protein [Azospirillum sp. SYSU D00513]